MNNPTGRFNDLPLTDKALILAEKSKCIFHIESTYDTTITHHIFSLNRYFVVMSTKSVNYGDEIIEITMIHDMRASIIDMMCNKMILSRSFKDNLPVGMLVED